MKIAICGHGRSGKDTASNWLNDHTTLCYHESTSQAAAKLCFDALAPWYGYSTVQEAFDDRHNHRTEWAKLIWQHNAPDGLTLYRGMLETGDILNGIRRAAELHALCTHTLLDLILWIERDVPNDPSCEIDSNVAHVVINNNGTLQEFYHELRKFAKTYNLTIPTCSP